MRSVQDREEDEDNRMADAEDAAQPGRPVGIYLPMRIDSFVLQAHRPLRPLAAPVLHGRAQLCAPLMRGLGNALSNAKLGATGTMHWSQVEMHYIS